MTVTSTKSELRKNECNAKELAFLRSLPSDSNFGESRVTEKRVQCNAKELAFLRSLPSDSNLKLHFYLECIG